MTPEALHTFPLDELAEEKREGPMSFPPPGEAEMAPVSDYSRFLARKALLPSGHGFEPNHMPDYLFDFQASLVEWAVQQGRAALFADCGLGKTLMALVWAENIRRHTGKPVLMVTPLAVSFQVEAEAQKFGVDASTSRNGKPTGGITVTNYERLELFSPDDFGGLVCDESSAIKSFDGVRRQVVTEFMRTLPYRLLCTATAAPNDYIELGTSSEALGHLGHMDMLGRFFTNKERSAKAIGGRWRARGADQWRLKGHAEEPFWRWVTSWARAVRRPSDLGFDDGRFHLPDLLEREHIIEASRPAEGTLFDVPVTGLHEEREEARRTLTERCEKAAELAQGHKISVLWCNLNAEGDLLERIVPGSIQVKGSDSNDYKEMAARWFVGDLCICDQPEFRSKLAAWDGSQNMLQLDALVTKLIRKNANAGKPNPANQTLIESRCAPTTKPTVSASSSIEETLPLGETIAAENGMPTTPSTGSSTRRPSGSGSAQTLTSVSRRYSGDSGSQSMTTEPCSSSKTAGVQSVALTSVTGQDADLLSTTVTNLGESEGFCVAAAISESVSSGMTQLSSNGRQCICGHQSGVRRLVTKPSMFGLGLNFQHCAHMTYFPSHSFEQRYQAIRRCWRFGQTNPVQVDTVTTEGGRATLANLRRKATQADRMFDALTEHMRTALAIERSESYPHTVEVPTWATSLTS